MSGGTVLFANPTAQSGKALQWIERARALLDEAGIPHSFIATEPDGGTVGLVRRAIDDDGARRIVYMGGDGTFAEIAKGILGSEHAEEVALGMLPTGTANDQGKSFGLGAGPGALAANVSVIAAGVTIDMDVGRVERLDASDESLGSDLFFDSASIGWGAEVLATRNRDRDAVRSIPIVRSVYRDHLVYAGAMVQNALKSYVARTAFDLEAVVDGQRHYYENLIDVIIKNTHVFGGEWVLSPDAEADDGLFEMVPIASRREFTSKLLATLRHSPLTEDDWAKVGVEHSKPVRGAEFILTVVQPGAKRPPAAQIDGEELGAGDKFRFTVLPRILRLIVPRAHAGA